MTSSERAEQIRDKALKAVADRITELGAEFHPAAVPIVAANVAMHVMADELLDDMRVPDALVVGHVARLTALWPDERPGGDGGVCLLCGATWPAGTSHLCGGGS